MPTRSWGTAARAVAISTLLALLAGCSSREERAEHHLDRANAFVAEGKLSEARLEFQSALRFDPQSVEANNRLAELEFENGNLPAAMAHVQEAYRIDPTDSEATLYLASLLKHDQPQRAMRRQYRILQGENSSSGTA